jgi:chromosome segregation ATPase
LKTKHGTITRRIEKSEAETDDAEDEGRRAVDVAEKKGKADLDALKAAHVAELKEARAKLDAVCKTMDNAAKEHASREAAYKEKLAAAKKAHDKLADQVDDMDARLKKVKADISDEAIERGAKARRARDLDVEIDD